MNSNILFFPLVSRTPSSIYQSNYMWEQTTIQKKQIKSNTDVIFPNNLNYSKNILNLHGIAFYFLSKENQD